MLQSEVVWWREWWNGHEHKEIKLSGDPEHVMYTKLAETPRHYESLEYMQKAEDHAKPETHEKLVYQVNSEYLRKTDDHAKPENIQKPVHDVKTEHFRKTGDRTKPENLVKPICKMKAERLRKTSDHAKPENGEKFEGHDQEGLEKTRRVWSSSKKTSLSRTLLPIDDHG